MIDFHNHLIPGVDDGAASIEETLAGLSIMTEQGVAGVVCTPHLNGSVTLDPEALAEYLKRIDAGWDTFVGVCRERFPALRVWRGAEILLDSPRLEVTNANIRLGGTRFVLVEFAFGGIPPKAEEALFRIRMAGIVPIIAHPERYQEVGINVSIVESWRRVGAFLQVNAGSFLGRYGSRAQSAANHLLQRGWIEYISSDYHARGACYLRDACRVIVNRAGNETMLKLSRGNAERMLNNQDPEPIAPVERRGLLKRVFRRR